MCDKEAGGRCLQSMLWDVSLVTQLFLGLKACLLSNMVREFPVVSNRSSNIARVDCSGMGAG